ncbi:helix-turn-helix domain-containing protein [Motilimonas cestriensis]|uniref:Helix-turn-helix domain-containing protein n=1 Tax=Motilimonas cestriensis TaxID=2742685 RepID=A0ABS8WE84_9GAMM|nr:helix-turn-helix domain-containing protein [Motilimonas cestriensis]
MWSASVSELQSEPITKSLYTDASSGILFHLAGDIKIGSKLLPPGVIFQPVSKVSEQISLFPGTQLAGLRFHPAIGYGVLGQHFDHPTPLTANIDYFDDLKALYSDLQLINNNQSRIDTLCCWAREHMALKQVIPESLQLALKHIALDATLADLDSQVSLSQRQIERLFKRWLEISPKQYQRILRVQKTINYLREHKAVTLVDVSQQFGFSDQAHMTREFRSIASITPSKL